MNQTRLLILTAIFASLSLPAYGATEIPAASATEESSVEPAIPQETDNGEEIRYDVFGDPMGPTDEWDRYEDVDEEDVYTISFDPVNYINMDEFNAAFYIDPDNKEGYYGNYEVLLLRDGRYYETFDLYHRNMFVFGELLPEGHYTVLTRVRYDRDGKYSVKAVPNEFNIRQKSMQRVKFIVETLRPELPDPVTDNQEAWTWEEQNNLIKTMGINRYAEGVEFEEGANVHVGLEEMEGYEDEDPEVVIEKNEDSTDSETLAAVVHSQDEDSETMTEEAQETDEESPAGNEESPSRENDDADETDETERYTPFRVGPVILIPCMAIASLMYGFYRKFHKE